MEDIINRQEKIDFGGKLYEVICSNYGNRLFIMISDNNLQKMGTILQVKREAKDPQAAATYSVQTLLGKDQPEFLVFGRAVGGHILGPKMSGISLILACGIREPDPVIIPLLLQTLDRLNIWDSSNT